MFIKESMFGKAERSNSGGIGSIYMLAALSRCAP
jgi:hypothetical protein